eukprot:1184161-Prorocentrum_minimum.AAC.2
MSTPDARRKSGNSSEDVDWYTVVAGLASSGKGTRISLGCGNGISGKVWHLINAAVEYAYDHRPAEEVRARVRELSELLEAAPARLAAREDKAATASLTAEKVALFPKHEVRHFRGPISCVSLLGAPYRARLGAVSSHLLLPQLVVFIESAESHWAGWQTTQKKEEAKSVNAVRELPPVSDIPTYSTSESENEEGEEEVEKELPRMEDLKLRLEKVHKRLKQAMDQDDQNDIMESLTYLHEFPPIPAEFLMVRMHAVLN